MKKNEKLEQLREAVKVATEEARVACKECTEKNEVLAAAVEELGKYSRCGNCSFWTGGTGTLGYCPEHGITTGHNYGDLCQKFEHKD